MKSTIAVILEVREGKVKRASLEALAEGVRKKADLGGPVTAILCGAGLAPIGEDIKGLGADHIVLLDLPEFAHYSTEGYRDAIVPVLKDMGCQLILLGATVLGRDLGPALAGKGALNCAYAAECTALKVENGVVLAERPVYAGKAIATVSAKEPPLLATLRPNVFSTTSASNGSATIESIAAVLAAGVPRGRATGLAAGSRGALDVAEADIVVAGGRGMGSPEGFAPVEALALALGGAVGASRAVVDMGWRPHAEQVGQTGKVVAPKLYIACGISGAIQHLAGMRTSKVIVAINKDPEAPIFKVADYGIVGDVHEVLAALLAAVKATA
ncbi:MAG TPA: electron transfer flavoprotein subunit alpha/FixB family protein [Planctomycetota bacterium]|jgi:electron transfer flavoprotein alpha subunit|nr:electron transfer flavoprotein subunit alpha/FixB family protein [Planctomycetota bacterium]